MISWQCFIFFYYEGIGILWKGICSMSIKNVALNIREREKLSRTRTEYGSEVKAYWGYCAGKV